MTGSRDDGAFSRGKATPRDPMRSGTMKSTNPFELPACDGFDYRAGAPATRPGRRPAAAVTAAGSRGRTLCESSDGCPTGAPHVAGADGPHALTALPRDVASRSPGKTASMRATTATDTATARTKCRAISRSCLAGRVIPFCLPGPSRKAFVPAPEERRQLIEARGRWGARWFGAGYQDACTDGDPSPRLAGRSESPSNTRRGR